MLYFDDSNKLIRVSWKLSSQLTENTEFPHRKDQPRIVLQDTTDVYTDNHTDIKHSYILWLRLGLKQLAFQ